MKIYILVQPDYDGVEIVGVFSSKEKAEAALEKGYWRPETYEIREDELDPEVGNKFEPFWEHTINQHKDYGPRMNGRAHNEDGYIPNEHVWYADRFGVQAVGLGKTAEEATNRANELRKEHADLHGPESHLPVITIPRPDLIVRKQ